MGITIQAVLLLSEDPATSLSFYRDILGFEVRKDVVAAGRRVITVSAGGQPDMSIVLEVLSGELGGPSGGSVAQEGRLAECGDVRVILATGDLDETFERLEASGAEVAQEPIRHPDGIRDCAFFDPAGNVIYITERP